MIGVTEQSSPDDVIAVLNKTGVDLLLTGALRSTSALDIAHTVDRLYSTYGQTRLAWNIGGRIAGHLASLVGFAKVKLSYLLLLTLPGTPVFNYGDEIGLQDNVSELKVFIKRIHTDPVFLSKSGSQNVVLSFHLGDQKPDHGMGRLSRKSDSGKEHMHTVLNLQSDPIQCCD